MEEGGGGGGGGGRRRGGGGSKWRAQRLTCGTRHGGWHAHRYNPALTDLCMQLLAVGTKKTALLRILHVFFDFVGVKPDALPTSLAPLTRAEAALGVSCRQQTHDQVQQINNRPGETMVLQTGTDTTTKTRRQHHIMGTTIEAVSLSNETGKVMAKKKFILPFIHVVG